MSAVYRSGKGTQVVVRKGARELHIDGTFASYYEPGQVSTGSVWDALGAALLVLPPRRRRSVLLLGLGGGSAARLARALAPRAHIQAVEIDPNVVRLARQWFDLDALDVEVTVADARQVVARSRRRFDAVLEDVFVGDGRDAAKPDGLPEPGLIHAARRLSPGGVLASNALDEAPEVAQVMTGLFPRLVRIEIEGYDNQVFVGSRAGLDARRMRAAVARDPVLTRTLPRLRFRTISGRIIRTGTARRSC